MKSEEVVHDLLGYDGLKIVQRKDALSFSLDSTLLADFVKITPRMKKIVDFGTGNAPIPLFLSMKTKAKIIGFEIQEEMVSLALKSVKMNHLENQIEIQHIDIKQVSQFYPASSMDLITCNPPFFKVSEDKITSQDTLEKYAKHEYLLTLEQMITSAKYLLKDGGLLCFIHRVDRLQEMMVLLNQHRFSIKRIRYVYPKQDGNALMVLFEAKKSGKLGSMILEPPLYVHESNGSYTKEILAIFRRGMELENEEDHSLSK